MAVLWMTEALPLWGTALLPIVLFPVFGVMPGKSVAAHYVNDVIFLFLGGFLVAIARSARLPGWPVPREIAGIRPIDVLRAMRNVLEAEGSPALRAAIAEHEDEIFELAEDAKSVDDVIKTLTNRAEFDA